MRSTYLRLHQKRHTYAEDKNFQIVKDALSELRGYVNQKRLHQITTDPPKTHKTIRRYFKMTRTIAFDQSKSLAESTGAHVGKAARHIVHPSQMWQTYYVKLRVLAQARQWLSATERLDPIADAPATPKTLFQLADAIKQPMPAEYAPKVGFWKSQSSKQSPLCKAHI